MGDVRRPEPARKRARQLGRKCTCRHARWGELTIETSNAHLDDRYAAEHVDVSPGQYVLIAVADTGFGMTPEQRAKAFEPFFTTKGAGRGTGLGLDQVYGFAKQSGGHARIYSEPGHAPKDSVPLSTAREKVLLVEDETRVRKLTADSLPELGYIVLQAEGAETALQAIDTHEDIALLFTDVVMPNVDGRK